MNPIHAMLWNAKLNRWHPILFLERPLPGGPGPEVPVRHKSLGHHTVGFETRQAALDWIDAVCQPGHPVRERYGPARKCVAGDIPWDGEGTPALVHYFSGDEAPVPLL